MGIQQENINKKNSTVERFVRDKFDFMQQYIQDISGILGGFSLSEQKILFAMWKKAIENKGKLFMVKSEKEEIVELVKLKNIQTVSNAVSTFRKKNVLLKNSGSTYQLNPMYFSMNINEHTEHARIVIDYTFLQNINEEKDFEDPIKKQKQWFANKDE